ncbi:MAG: rhomboid family intramembrane serine protease [Bacteroidales bacterium]|jgi:membrane associated rhomboid family serine protease|nr:rhomboid family intramembrane serine protease [Fournierella massiliensis]MCF2556783.1 rhomboid family intramembrane serine protease [Fournierella massiliensis]MCI6740036.1 rhomboid family intramembrane serine protease [Bacteroidales bacterium]
MNNWLYKMERRFGRYGIPNLAKYLALGQLVVWVIVMFFYGDLLGLITLSRSGLMHGQIWRLVTFVFVPPLTFNPLYLVLDLYFLYFVGTSLENSWGSFRFTLYYLIGMAGAIVSCLLLGTYSSSTLLYSLFFAFACLYPDVEVLLFFILPIKVKWMGIAAAALYLWDFLWAGMWYKLGMVLGLVNFFLFFGPTLWQNYQNRKRREAWKNQWR